MSAHQTRVSTQANALTRYSVMNVFARVAGVATTAKLILMIACLHHARTVEHALMRQMAIHVRVRVAGQVAYATMKLMPVSKMEKMIATRSLQNVYTSVSGNMNACVTLVMKQVTGARRALTLLSVPLHHAKMEVLAQTAAVPRLHVLCNGAVPVRMAGVGLFATST